MRHLSLLLPLFVACHGGADEEAPTYYADVKPILDTTCARCHTDGGVAPVSFDDPANVVAEASLIVANTQAGTMPPPSPDPACHDYEASDRMFLSDESKAILKEWYDSGMELGDAATTPEPPAKLTLAPFDIEFRGEAFTPTFQGDPNEYRCFGFDFDSDTDKFATAFEAIPDRTSIVHHVVLFLDHSDSADTSGQGASCSGFGDPEWEVLAAWGPGEIPTQFGDSTGVRIPAHARLVLQMHYFDSGDSGPDQTAYGVKLTDSVDTEVFNLALTPENEFVIPAGEADHVESFDYTWPSDYGSMTIYGVWAHMHLLGSGFDYSIDKAAGGNECVMDMDAWNFHNQPLVMFSDPVQVVAGDRLHMACHWDNSANNPAQLADPPVDVVLGERSNDEMCFGFTYASFQ